MLRARLSRLLLPAPDPHAPVAVAPAVALRRLLRAFWPYARPYRGKLLLGLPFLGLVPAMEAAGIWLFGVLVDDVLVPRDLGALGPLALAMLGLLLVGGVVAYADDLLGAWIGERFVLDLRIALFSHLQRLPLHTLDRRRLGDLVARLNGDVAAIESFVLAGIGDGLAAILRIAFFGTALLLLEWRLALAALVVVPAFLLAGRSFTRLTKHAAREKRRRTGSLSAVAEERLAAAPLVQVHGREAAETERFAHEARRIMEAQLAATRIRGLYAPVVDLIELAGALVVLALGTWALGAGTLTLGGLLAFLTYLTRLYGPFRDLGALANSMFSAAAGGERVLELLHEPAGVADRPGARRLGRVRGTLALRGVTFRHPGAAGDALRGADLDVPAGRTVALVGPSGAGKSTIVRLLARLHDPDAGRVELDGHDVRDLRVETVRGAVAVLLQETLLLDATVRENVAFGRPGAGDEDVRAALATAGAGDLDLDARVGQRGRSLSGGQARRVALARELLRDTPVLVLDEPTTGLDAATRDALLPDLRRACAGRTAVIVTHDPVVAAVADEVLEVRDGQVAVPAAAPTEARGGVAAPAAATEEARGAVAAPAGVAA